MANVELTQDDIKMVIEAIFFKELEAAKAQKGDMPSDEWLGWNILRKKFEAHEVD
jgi:hypothetical protein